MSKERNGSWLPVPAPEPKVELKPCPFCGEPEELAVIEAALINEGDSPDDLCFRKYVECQNCGALGPWADRRRAARIGWNERKRPLAPHIERIRKGYAGTYTGSKSKTVQEGR
jgi:Lar family restriction alleviation protein